MPGSGSGGDGPKLDVASFAPRCLGLSCSRCSSRWGVPITRKRAACSWWSPKRVGRSGRGRSTAHACNYGARGPLSLERLSALPDGRLAYRMKRPSPTVQTHLVMAPVAFLRRLAALVPPPRANFVRYFGVFAPNARVRHRVVPLPPPALLPKAPLCPVAPEPVRPLPRPHRPIPWADLLKRTFQTDVLTCPRCGGKRRPSSSTCGFPPGRFHSPRPPPRPSSASGERRPRFETHPALTTGHALLYPRQL
ncbi:MAG TPA: transposase [Myxococcaceae bacterium]|nr:transposase [Myxococcaceae bacterium]